MSHNSDSEEMFTGRKAAHVFPVILNPDTPSGARTITQGAAATTQQIGRGPIPYDKRKFKYDATRGRATVQKFEVTKEDRMSPADAGTLLDRIHTVFGINRAEEHVLTAFDKALFFNHTINGGSTLQPGRAKIILGESVFDVNEIDNVLDVNKRRFFRAFADEIAEVNREVMETYDPYDPVSRDNHSRLVQVAVTRGLQKYPYLAHDSADACSNLTPTERLALSVSKRVIIGSSENTADGMFANDRVIGSNRTKGEVRERAQEY